MSLSAPFAWPADAATSTSLRRHRRRTDGSAIVSVTTAGGDHPAAEDCWGRALRGLGTAAARGATRGIREESLSRFDRGAHVSSAWPHALAFAALGATEVLGRWPDHSGALTLPEKASAIIGQAPADPVWPWPARRLTYANAAIAVAVIVAGWKLGRDRVLRDGMRMLEWLLTVETRDGHLSVVPAGG